MDSPCQKDFTVFRMAPVYSRTVRGIVPDSRYQLVKSTRSPTAEMFCRVWRTKKKAVTRRPATISAPATCEVIGARATSTCQSRVATKEAKAKGTRYFQHRLIIWSTRRRGSVQRTHTTTLRRTSVLVTKTSMERSWSPHHPAPGSSPAPRAAAKTSGPAKGTCQPPKNSVTEMADITHRFPNSTRKKRAKRKEEYSER